MVRFTVLGSGSRGNGTIITGGRTRILVDAGFSCRELFRRMRLVGENPESLDAILITHEHQDHVGGLAVTARKLGIPVYFTEATHRAWMRWLSPRRQMTYAQWLEQCRRQAAERQAEAITAEMEGEPDDPSQMGILPPAQPLQRQTLRQQRASCRQRAHRRAPRGSHPPPAVEYFEAGRKFSIGDLESLLFHYLPRRRRSGGLRL